MLIKFHDLKKFKKDTINYYLFYGPNIGLIEDTIKNLPEDLRSALTLREYEGLSYEEIADVMECPIGTVRSRIFRAREAVDNQIRPIMEQNGYHPV